MKSIADIIGALNAEVSIEALSFPTSSVDPTVAADAAAVAAGQRAIGDKWKALVGSPHAFLTHHIGHDLAYPGFQQMDVPQCELLA